MVDIAPEISKTTKAAAVADVSFLRSCITDRADALKYISQLPDDIFSTGYQSKTFLSAWLNQPSSKPYFLVFCAPGHGAVLLPLERTNRNTAIYCGGTHANGNFPVGLKQDIEALQCMGIKDIQNALKDIPEAPDAIFLERQHAEFEGVKNPFVFASSATSPNVALSLSLEGGFTDVMARHHGKRKRKRMRNHTRKLESLGQVEIVQHVPCQDVVKTLHAFFDMKAERFKAAGICDVFAETDVQEMFAQMYKHSCDTEKPNHMLKCVKLNGTPISVIGCTVHRGRLTVEFGTFDDKYAAGGPGDLLFFHAIEDACQRGLETFDFGIGDEFYKRSWCEIETWHRDTAIGISAKGAVHAKLKLLRTNTVRAIKSNSLVWKNLKKLRKHVGRLRSC